MQKPFMILTTAVLMNGVVFAQGQNESVSDIMKELSGQEIAPAAAPDVTNENVAAQPAEEMVAEPQPKEAPVATVDLAAKMTEDVLPAEVSDPVVLSEFAAAQQGFERGVKGGAGNMPAHMSRSKLERAYRKTEIKSMGEVDSAWSTDLVVRSYALGKDACEKMELSDAEDTMDVAYIFPQVDFPKGASAIFQPKGGTLFVRNTSENLSLIEAILGAMDLAKFSSDVDQVEIEAKFVEVNEGTLEALGFQWDIDGSAGIGGGTGVSVVDGTAGLFGESLRGNPLNSAGGALPFSRTVDMGAGQATASGDWSSFNLIGTFNKYPADVTVESRGKNPFNMLISALDQSSGADVLSAPRIVTKSGEEATMRVGDLHSYPEVYEGGSTESTILSVTYQDFTEKLLGVELSVTPEVEGNEITLTLNPRITELAGWQNWQLASANSIYNHRIDRRYFFYTHDAIVAKLPIYQKREIETEVTIADGSTIGMGGLINEKTVQFEDKVPVLGSLPLVGRLFRHEGERVVKRNLLMFVTAKRVEASGRINTSRSYE